MNLKEPMGIRIKRRFDLEQNSANISALSGSERLTKERYCLARIPVLSRLNRENTRNGVRPSRRAQVSA